MIKILIVLRGRLYAEGLRSLLRNSAGMKVVGVTDGEADNPLLLADRLRPDVLLTDTASLQAFFPNGAPKGVRVIIVGSEGEDLADLILNGTVCGAMLESSGPNTLETAVRAVSMGVVWMEGAWPSRKKGRAGLKGPEPDPLHA